MRHVHCQLLSEYSPQTTHAPPLLASSQPWLPSVQPCRVGDSVGLALGASLDGDAVGDVDTGDDVGLTVGLLEIGAVDGDAVGAIDVGLALGATVGVLERGAVDGDAVGDSDDGLALGATVGAIDVGAAVGDVDGADVGDSDVGADVGWRVTSLHSCVTPARIVSAKISSHPDTHQ